MGSVMAVRGGFFKTSGSFFKTSGCFFKTSGCFWQKIGVFSGKKTGSRQFVGVCWHLGFGIWYLVFGQKGRAIV
ncbi:MAG: hypothetical protein KDH98_15815 [Calditrichaeota bacterium]|nr:hypothetical protein [Calditrichota bacterium]